MRAIDYYEVLDRTHQALLPRTYLEIGTRHGDALALALPGTQVVGVDPAANVLRALPKGAVIEAQTSDAFFDGTRADEAFGGLPVDLAFIDGMHLFEFALRDFLNIERRAHAGSVVLLHDCLPPTEIVARRKRVSRCWTGDVWKVLLYLAAERPDLEVCVFDAQPTGLGMIRNLDPNHPLVDVEAVVARYADAGFETFEDFVASQLDVVRGGWSEIRQRLPDDPWRSEVQVAALVDERNDRRPSFSTRLRRAKRWIIQTELGQRANLLRRRLLGHPPSPSSW